MKVVKRFGLRTGKKWPSYLRLALSTKLHFSIFSGHLNQMRKFRFFDICVQRPFPYTAGFREDLQREEWRALVMISFDIRIDTSTKATSTPFLGSSVQWSIDLSWLNISKWWYTITCDLDAPWKWKAEKLDSGTCDCLTVRIRRPLSTPFVPTCH